MASNSDYQLTVNQRLQQALSAIHSNHTATVTPKVEDIAAACAWSRWSLQRAFKAQIGTDVAKYMRNLRLSAAAWQLLSSDFRIVDIALNAGFDIEANFSRAFKHKFGASPSSYKKRGLIKNIDMPACHLHFLNPAHSSFAHISVDTLSQRTVYGMQTVFFGSLKDQRILASIKQLWQQLQRIAELPDFAFKLAPTAFGVWDLNYAYAHEQYAKYAACLTAQNPAQAAALCALGLKKLTIPSQSYVVISFYNFVGYLPQTVRFLLENWLPNSQFLPQINYDLEIYPLYQLSSSKPFIIKYAIPIIARNAPN